jgi:hypothetical protein
LSRRPPARRRTRRRRAGPGGSAGGIWQSATGLEADSAGNIYFISADGTFDLAGGGRDISDSVMEMRPRNGTLAVVGYFTPFYQACLNKSDQDYGSGSPLLLPREIIVIGLAHELYNTQQDASRDAIPGYDNFCVPTAADGRVFGGTQGELIIYGLLK